MLSYVVLAGKRGQSVDPELIERMGQADLPELAFVPEKFVHWSNPRGTVHFFGWQAFTEINDVGSHWHIDEGGLTAFSGHLWPRESGWDWSNGSWASQLAGFYRSNHPVDSIEDLFGVFTALHLPADGIGFAVTDMLSGGMLYIAETSSTSIASSRAALSARAATPPGQPVERDVEGAGWITYISANLSQRTGFSRVSSVPFRSDLRIDPDRGIDVLRRPVNYWDSPEFESLPHRIEPISEYVEQQLRTAIRTLGSVPAASHQLRLSGGRDSRLVLGLIIAEGLQKQFEMFTYGLEHSPDLIAARNIASALDLRWTGEVRAVPMSEDAFEQQMRVHAFQTSGLCPGWSPKGGLKSTPGITMTGNYSELFRFGLMSTTTLNTTSFEEAQRLILNHSARSTPQFMHPDARSTYQTRYRHWLSELHHEGVEPSRLASMVLPHTLARWDYGAPTEVNTRMWSFPLYVPATTRAAQHLPPSERFTERFHFDVILHASETLAKLPLIDKGWLPETYAHLPNAQEFAAIPPIRYDGPDTVQWRVAHFDALRPIFVKHLSDQANPVYELVDFNQVQRILSTPSISYGVRRYLDNVLVTAIWLGGHELPARINRSGEVDTFPQADLPLAILSFGSDSADNEIQTAPPAQSRQLVESVGAVTAGATIQGAVPRIVIVEQAFPSAYEAHAADLFLHLLHRGWDVSMLVTTSTPQDWQKFPEIAQESLLRSRIHDSDNPQRALRELRPDLVIFPSCQSAHEYLAHGRTTGFRSVVVIDENDLAMLGANARQFGAVMRIAGAFIVRRPSDWQICLDAGFPHETRQSVVPMGVDAQFFEPAESRHTGALGDAESPLRLVSAGRLEWDRGRLFAVQAVAILRDYGVSAELTIIGDGTQREALQFEISALGLDQWVSLPGAQSRRAVRDAIQNADVYIQTSLRSTSSLSTSEAQAMRLPVVAFNLNRQLPSLREGVTALIVPPRDIAALAERLTRLAADPQLRRRLGSTGRSHVTQNFTIEQETTKLEALFTATLDRAFQAAELRRSIQAGSVLPHEPDVQTYLNLEQDFARQVQERS